MKPVGKPDAGNPHVRFDERGRETERPSIATAPVLDSTPLMIMSGRDARGRAAASVPGWQGGSPFQASPLRPVTERNCVAARRGGEQREVKKSSVG
jgi:hypothetical protein